MESQTLILNIQEQDREDFRKALMNLKGFAEFQVNERPDGPGVTTFYVTSENAMFFYKLGLAYGGLKEFRSNSFDHRQRRLPDEE